MPNQRIAIREQRVLEIGQRLLEQAAGASLRSDDFWSKWLIDSLSDNEPLRVQMLRFVDVLPSLTDDHELVEHLLEYFNPDQVPLPRLLAWSLSLSRISEGLTAKSVRRFSALLATRFMGGSEAESAFRTVSRLRDCGMGFSLDLLGEAVVSESEADRYQAAYLKLIKELPPLVDHWEPNELLDVIDSELGPRLYVSLKLTSLYSQIDPANFSGSINAIASRLRPIFMAARQYNVFVCVDMEQYTYKAIVLECFKSLLMEPEFKNWSNVGLAMQAYLRETENDIAELIAWVKRRGCPITVRLVRGAYWDYETVISAQNSWEAPVWQQKGETDACYERCMEMLFSNTPHVRIAVATHNVRSLALALSIAEERDLNADEFEIQMLFGMAEALKKVLSEMGYCLRVYVPFGETIPGMAYLVRRLLENSSSQSMFLSHHSTHLDALELLSAPVAHTELGIECSLPQELGNSGAFMNLPLRRFINRDERDRFTSALATVRSRFGARYPLIIDGQSVETHDTIVSVNPARPEELIGRVAKASFEHAEMAVRGAVLAQKCWSEWNADARAAILLRAAHELKLRRDEFAAWEIFEAGKSWREADANVAEAIDFLEFYAIQAQKLKDFDKLDVPGESNRCVRVGLGVGLIVPPWNFPLAILAGMTSAAIVMGNTVILKPSSQTPVIAARFVDLLVKAGLPAGVVQFLPGSGDSVGEYLVKHPAIQFIAFTGSEAVGTRISTLAANRAPGQRHLKRVMTEMGGKNAIIVDRDADLDDVVAGTIRSAFGYQGQKCSACSRLIVIGEHYAALVARLKDAAASLCIGYPEEPGVSFGPVIEAAARDRILQAILRGRTVARLEFETSIRGLDGGYFVGPTIFTDVPPRSALGQQEIFGPVLSVMKADSLSVALRIANDSAYALTGGLYSRNPANVARCQREFEVGNLYVNRAITGALVNRQPFGGAKLSGSGCKAGGRDYLSQFTTTRVFTENTLRRGYAPSA